ncbi:MAG: DUF2986 domain-containing protein [Sulfurimonas sp.]|nr:MAG: DUF2986 domain-containing protein [Sulfurimonas sp.]
MNRKNKLQKIHDKRLKRHRAKTKTSSKPPYICKADRAKAEAKKSAEEFNTEQE